MGPVSLCTTISFNIGIDIFCCILTLLIYARFRMAFADTYDNRMLRHMVSAIFLVLFTDAVMWILDGRSGTVVRVLDYADNVLYFCAQFFITFAWVRYIRYRVYGRIMDKKSEFLFVRGPFWVSVLIALCSPVTGWCFYLDEGNVYRRGSVSTPMTVLMLLYLLSVSVTTLIQSRKEVLYERKKELQTMALIAIPPLIGGTLQTAFYGLSLIWPSTVVSYLLVLFDKENRAMSQDTLTRLNNRRSVERYLGTYGTAVYRPLTVIMMDINNFKGINDRYGHDAGDKALKETAATLKAVFNGTSAFLSRYGGDEFVIAIPGDREDAAREAVKKIRESICTDCAEKCGMPLSVSAGYAVSVKDILFKPSELLRKADEEMYREKSAYHRAMGF